MKFHCIEVSGIRNITFNRKTLWGCEGSNWVKLSNGREEDGIRVFDITDRRSHEQMMAIVNVLKWDRRYRMWIHGDCLNIVRKSDYSQVVVAEMPITTTTSSY